MNILIVHGIDGKAGIHWQQWLHDQLVQDGHKVVMPTLSSPDHPDRQTWLQEIIGYMANLDPKDTVIVAHSLGVASTLDYLEQATEPIKGFVSVSGFAVPLGLELNEYFMQEKPIDFTKVVDKIGKAYVLYGDNDPYVNLVALQGLAKDLGVQPIIFHDGGHLNTEAGYTQFPQLLSIIHGIDGDGQL